MSNDSLCAQNQPRTDKSFMFSKLSPERAPAPNDVPVACIRSRAENCRAENYRAKYQHLVDLCRRYLPSAEISIGTHNSGLNSAG